MRNDTPVDSSLSLTATAVVFPLRALIWLGLLKIASSYARRIQCLHLHIRQRLHTRHYRQDTRMGCLGKPLLRVEVVFSPRHPQELLRNGDGIVGRLFHPHALYIFAGFLDCHFQIVDGAVGAVEQTVGGYGL